jgi:hypothetical protein
MRDSHPIGGPLKVADDRAGNTGLFQDAEIVGNADVTTLE